MKVANQADGSATLRKVESPLVLLDRMEKILVNHTNKKTFIKWVKKTIIGLEMEISSCLPSEKEFAPNK